MHRGKNFKTPKDTAANYNLQELIPATFQENKPALRFHKNGQELPRHFEHFVSTPLCLELCESILDYCKYLIKLDKKKQQLEKDARLRKIPPPKVLRSETDKLNLKAKRMSDNYGRLIF